MKDKYQLFFSLSIFVCSVYYLLLLCMRLVQCVDNLDFENFLQRGWLAVTLRLPSSQHSNWSWPFGYLSCRVPIKHNSFSYYTTSFTSHLRFTETNFHASSEMYFKDFNFHFLTSRLYIFGEILSRCFGHARWLISRFTIWFQQLSQRIPLTSKNLFHSYM